jgi:uncharacterized phage-associated protein
MAIQFTFDIRKMIAAIAFLMSQQNGEADMFLALKTLYLADKEALTRWGKTITGDDFVSLDKGPVLSKTYNLFKGIGSQGDKAQWANVFSERVNHSIRLLKPVDVDILSEREMEVLESSRKTIARFAPWDIADWLHQTCPEWTDPHGSMIPIDPAIILQNAGRTQPEIELIESSNRQHEQARAMLGIR